MENDSDKAMRDKLSGLTAPFDPKAWEQMEVLLDKKRKPKGFAGWWPGGIAACLLLGAGIYGYYQFGHSAVVAGKTVAATNNNIESLKANKDRTNGDGIHTAVSPDKGFQTGNGNLDNRNENTSKLNGENSRNVGLANTSVSVVPAKQAPEITTAASTKSNQSKNHGASPVGAGFTTALHATGFTTALHATGFTTALQSPGSTPALQSPGSTTTLQSPASTRALHSPGFNENFSAAKTSNIASAGAAVTSEIFSATNTNITGKVLESIALYPARAESLASGEEKLEEATGKSESDEINLKKPKKKIFSYSLGASVNVTGTSLGTQSDAKSRQFFYGKPSYMAGMTHDFLFLNLIAITNSIQFSQTSYQVLNAKSTIAHSLKNYTSSVTELAIPIGIKAYIVSNRKFKFYAGAGIINHIKLKETFNYNYYHDSASITMPANSYFPNQTQFANNSVSVTSVSGIGPAAAGTTDFGLNHGRRYYTSFYASAGVEYILKKHVLFFTEPLFYMALQKVGIQDKYKYNLGLNGGIRYQF